MSVVFSSDGKTLASGSGDKTIRLWDVSVYKLFLQDGRATAFFTKFMQGAQFFWQTQQDGLEFKRRAVQSLYPVNGYHFVHEDKYRPLLNPPTAGQSKFDQILAWAREQLEEK